LHAENVKSIVMALWKNKSLNESDIECLELIVAQFDEFYEEFVKQRT
jgi:hypothetical protein